jgi:hypothetical protein
MFYKDCILSAVFKKHIFFIKTIFLSQIQLNGILNCETFSVAPSINNENTKKRAVPFKIDTDLGPLL